MEGVIVSLAAPVSAVLTALIAAYVALKRKHSNVKQENKILTIELNSINILFNHNLLAIIDEHVTNIFDETKVNRFLILFAVNGKTHFNFVTVCMERTNTGAMSGSIFRYNRLEIDDHYKSMLKQVELQGNVHLEVSTMPPSILKSIYESRDEKVTFSCVKFLKRINVDENNDIVLYSSIATTNNEDFTSEEQLIIKRNFDVIKNEARNISYQ
jgi:hypothetical protein